MKWWERFAIWKQNYGRRKHINWRQAIYWHYSDLAAAYRAGWIAGAQVERARMMVIVREQFDENLALRKRLEDDR